MPQCVHTPTHAWAPTFGKPTGTGMQIFPTTGTFKHTRWLTMPTPTQVSLEVTLLTVAERDEKVVVLRKPTDPWLESALPCGEMVILLVV